MFMNRSFFTGFFAAGMLLAAQSSLIAADTNVPAQSFFRPGAPGAARAGQPPVMSSMAVGGLFGVMTDQQRDSYQEVLKGLRPKFVEIESEVRTARNDLFNASLSPKFDETVIRQKALAVAQLEAELTVLRVKAISQIQPQLTPDQIERVKADRAPARPPEGPIQHGAGTTTTNHDANGLPPKQ